MINPERLQVFLIIPLLLNLVLLASLITYGVRQRMVDAWRFFVGVSLCLMVWNAGYIMEILSAEVKAKIFFSNISFTALAMLSPAWFALASIQAGLYARFKRHMGLILAIPIATILLLWTDNLHHLFRIDQNISYFSGYAYLAPAYGHWFYWVYLPFSYLLLGFSFFILLWSLSRQQPIYRKQTWAMIISLAMPYGVNLAATFNIIDLPYYDLTPITLTVSCLIIAYALFNFRLLKVVPLARDLIFDQMADGVMVLDKQRRLVDLNHAASRIMQFNIGDTIHNPLNLITEDKFSNQNTQVQISIGTGADQRHYNARISAVSDGEGNLLGWAVLLHDDTENLRLMEQLQHLATIDPLTEVFNRRYFMQLLNEEWMRGRRYDRTMTLLIMDMDFFKQVNDEHGHLAGDAVLKEITEVCRQNLRDVDKIGRFGGEEFTFLLPETSRTGAMITAERLRRLIESHVVHYEGQEIKVTASFGIAELPPDKDVTSVGRFIKAADDALYHAKRTGRNRVVAYHLDGTMEEVKPDHPFYNAHG